MDELNKNESDNLAVLIALILNQAKWLARALIVIGLLGLASLVPLLNGPVLNILLTVMIWYAVGTMIAICVLALLAYYYVNNCVSQQLKRYIKQAKKESGK
ncbi:hypothetical protein C4O30_05590 [Lactiplantibacillus plantarum]|uniref:hypothetical protein n=1 Tax=Lactiplantibacillus plantarum TaxID=1590 RepID=UPI000CCEB430|nr:hypothetical protein [Lactiplantibacillus plantarum]AVE82490.1 hypothetical protein C4O30_05590 [Lactiplantibacillus plantarum]PNW64229.1 hypothetical protein ACZ99_01710 [Lactobacillus sp. ATCC 15578]